MPSFDPSMGGGLGAPVCVIGGGGVAVIPTGWVAAAPELVVDDREDVVLAGIETSYPSAPCVCAS